MDAIDFLVNKSVPPWRSIYPREVFAMRLTLTLTLLIVSLLVAAWYGSSGK
jgi:hypothetical protein